MHNQHIGATGKVGESRIVAGLVTAKHNAALTDAQSIGDGRHTTMRDTYGRHLQVPVHQDPTGSARRGVNRYDVKGNTCSCLPQGAAENGKCAA